MTAQELNTYIDKVLGNSLRCLLPSYWWKRLLKLVVEYADKKITKIDNEVNSLTEKVNNEVNSLTEKLLGITISTGNIYVDVYADGKRVRIEQNMTKKIPVKTRFSFALFPGGVTSIDLSLFDSSKMSSMSNLFRDCSNLTSLDVSYLDTSNVINMSGMFANCTGLNCLVIDSGFTSFDTSNVTNMEEMFCNCGNPDDTSHYLGLDGFNTSKVTNMRNMFKDASLRIGGYSDFDTSNVTDMSGMFENCYVESPYTTLNYDTSNVRDMSNMFLRFNPEYLILGKKFFKTAYVTSIDLSGNDNWYESYFIQSIVTNSYDRTADGLSTLELKIHSNVYAYLTDEHKSTLTDKGYVITSVNNEE